MANSPTTVSGNAISDICVRYAGLLNIDIYDKTKASLPSEMHAAYDLNKQHWEVIWEDKRPDGFLARLYAPKAANDSDPTGVCPPVLAFRGSDSKPEDFAELAGAMKITWSVFGDTPGPGSINQSGVVDQSLGAAEDLSGLTMAKIRTKGLFEESLFAGVSGSKAVGIGGWEWSSTNVTVSWAVDASLFYGHNGDWAVNFAQGLGRNIPPQYENAIAAGRYAAGIAKQRYGGRLIVTGHSLGGGLASAASIAARQTEPDLMMRARTFNAAGLHAQTAQLAGGTLATGAQVPIRALHVKDEILNSMQARTRLVPLLADLLDWGNKSMPPAIANPTASQGKSPGHLEISGRTYNPVFSDLPKLFTIDDQKVGPELGPLGAILGIANSSANINAFLDGAVDYIFDEISEGDVLTYGELTSLGTHSFMARQALAEGLAALGPAITGAGPVPTVEIGDTDYINDLIESFFNGFLQDAVTLVQIMMLSGDYHTLLPCVSTFLLDQP